MRRWIKKILCLHGKKYLFTLSSFLIVWALGLWLNQVGIKVKDRIRALSDIKLCLFNCASLLGGIFVAFYSVCFAIFGNSLVLFFRLLATIYNKCLLLLSVLYVFVFFFSFCFLLLIWLVHGGLCIYWWDLWSQVIHLCKLRL